MGTGVDFSGAAKPDRKIWVASAGPAGGKLRLDFLDNGFSHARLVEKVLALPDGPILMDFPFGLSAASATNLGVRAVGLPSSMWRNVAACANPADFRARAKGSVTGPGSEADHKRDVDRKFSTPFAPVNLRLARQTFFGMSRVVLPLWEAGVSVYPWSAATAGKWIGEGCPASVLRARGIQPSGYKGRSADARTKRQAILDLLCSKGLLVPAPDRRRILDDREGDALDAVLLALAAAGLAPAQIDAGRQWAITRPTEGYIYL